jgi:hypothetical protein
MSRSVTERRTDRRQAIGDRLAAKLRLFLVFVAVSLATRWLGLVFDVIDMDETAHIVGAWEWLRGRVPYAEFVNNKPPLLYVYYAATQVLLGEGLRWVRLATTVVTVPLTALGISACFDHSRRGVVAGLVFLVYGAAFIGHDALSVNTEVLMLLPAAWAIALLRNEGRALSPWRAAAAGALVAAAALFRPQGLLFGPPLATVALWAGWQVRRIGAGVVAAAAMCAGCALVFAATWWVFASLGAADDLVYWVFTNNVAYAANPIALREAAERGLSYFVPFLIVTAPLWYASWTALRSKPRGYHALMGALLVAFALPAALVGFRFYPHYFVQLYVPLAFASAPAVEQWCQWPLSSAGRRFAVWSAAMLGLFAVSTVALYAGPWRVYREIDPVFARVGERLRADPCAARGTLFVWGYAPVFYYHARLPAASRFVVLAQARLTGYISGNLAAVRGEQAVEDVAEPRHWDWLMDDLAARRATFILDTAPAGIFRWNRYPMASYPRLQDYVDREFEQVDVISGVRVYRRNGCDATPAG